MTRALAPAPVAPLGRMLLAQTWCQILITWRIPAFSVTSLALPVVFFTFFGLRFAPMTDPAGFSIGAYLVASFGAYGVGQVMVYSFGIGVANERAQKIDLLMRATPVPPAVQVLARVLNALLFALVTLAVLIVYGIVVGGVRQDAAVWGAVIVRLMAGSLPFIGLGLAIGYLAGANAAPAMANLIYLPLAFASGLFVPLAQLPAFVQELAPYLPTYHYAQVAAGAIGANREPLATSVVWLAAYTVLFLVVAVRAYRQEERRKFW